MTESLAQKLKAATAERRTPVLVLDTVVYVSPLTIGDEMKINAMHPTDGAARLVEAIVMKCRDADGKPVFTVDDKRTLKLDVAGTLLGPVIAAMNGGSVEAQAKNSEAIP